MNKLLPENFFFGTEGDKLLVWRKSAEEGIVIGCF